MIYKIKDSLLFYNDNIESYVVDYYNYIFELIVKFINEEKINLHIIVGNQQIDLNSFDNNFSNNLLKISINFEHTLVKKGGRDTFNSPIGNIKTIEGDEYLVRIDKFNENIKSDIIIDYSVPNIKNILESGLFNEYSKKVIYIAPLLYEEKYEKKNREINCLTTFININEPRRKNLIDNIKNINLSHININNCFDKNELEKLYLNTKVMINIHQTEHHHTFEELRVLPALLCGIIVICEDSPLKESIPYNDFVIWSTYDNILDKTSEVLNNYEFYYNKIFGNTATLKQTILSLKEQNYNNLKTMFIYYQMDTLDIISRKYFLDKNICTGCHNYIPGYSSLFEKVRTTVKNVLEIGIGSVENGQMSGVLSLGYKTGNSLRCWRDYFLNANIYGIDIYSHPELNEDKIKTFVADQSNVEQLNNVILNIDGDLDIIIDDGSHNKYHQVISFMFLEKYLSNNSIYVIEDIQPDGIELFKDLSIFPSDFKDYVLQKYDIKIFDTRNEGNRYRADDFMIAFIRK
jgi:hypothetical protein